MAIMFYLVMLHLVCHSVSELMEENICFPTTRREMKAVADGFRQLSAMPGVVGAIDGTHVSIPAVLQPDQFIEQPSLPTT
jgi:hypothetical protein